MDTKHYKEHALKLVKRLVDDPHATDEHQIEALEEIARSCKSNADHIRNAMSLAGTPELPIAEPPGRTYR